MWAIIKIIERKSVITKALLRFKTICFPSFEIKQTSCWSCVVEGSIRHTVCHQFVLVFKMVQDAATRLRVEYFSWSSYSYNHESCSLCRAARQAVLSWIGVDQCCRCSDDMKWLGSLFHVSSCFASDQYQGTSTGGGEVSWNSCRTAKDGTLYFVPLFFLMFFVRLSLTVFRFCICKKNYTLLS